MGKRSGKFILQCTCLGCFILSIEIMQKLTFHVNTQGKLVDLVQKEVTILLQSALDVALSVVRANPDVLEGLGAQLEGIV